MCLREAPTWLDKKQYGHSLFHVWKTQKCEKLSCRILVLNRVDLTTDMFVSNHGNNNPGRASPQKEYVYALRFEQVVKDGVGKVAENSVFGSFLRQMQKQASQPLIVSDIHGAAVDFQNPMPEGGFKERFSVELQEGKTKKMIVLGFHLASKTPLSTLKRNMFDFLQKHGIFVRPHTGGFTHGVKTVYLGFIGKENPATADTKEIADKINQAMKDYWNDDREWTDESRFDFETESPDVITICGPTIPIVVERAKHSAKKDDKKVFADVLQVLVPSNFAVPARQLIDGALLKHGTMPEGYVPNGLRREDPDIYYELVREQAKWTYNHRNVQIQNVPPNKASL